MVLRSISRSDGKFSGNILHNSLIKQETCWFQYWKPFILYWKMISTDLIMLIVASHTRYIFYEFDGKIFRYWDKDFLPQITVMNNCKTQKSLNDSARCFIIINNNLYKLFKGYCFSQKKPLNRIKITIQIPTHPVLPTWKKPPSICRNSSFETKAARKFVIKTLAHR